MSSPKYINKTAPDMLQLNMENISKELNDLIVTSDQDIGTNLQYSQASVNTKPLAIATPAALTAAFQIPSYSSSTLYGQQQFLAGNGVQYVKHNLNYCGSLQQPQAYVGNNLPTTPTYITPLNFLCSVGKNANPSTLCLSQALNTSATVTPTYEFHYLRSHGGNDKKNSTSHLIGSNGSFRKMSRLTNKHQKVQTSNIADTQINVDLSTLDLFNADKQDCIVRRLFDLLRDLHCAVAEKPPSSDLDTISQFEETFASYTNKKSTMPSTLNVQNQVKQACRKLTIFICDMQCILANNKMFDPQMYAECEYYLNCLRHCLKQMEMYKYIEMEHKRGQFSKEEIKVHAERLSLLVEHTNQQIREVYIRFVAYDWYIGVVYRGEEHLVDKQTVKENNKEYSNKSKIGVINEILQLCNTTATPISETTNPTKMSTPQATSIIATKPEMTNTNISSMNLAYSKEMLNVKSLLKTDGDSNKNKNLFNVCKPASVVNTSHHTRHPVFYIG